MNNKLKRLIILIILIGLIIFGIYRNDWIGIGCLIGGFAFGYLTSKCKRLS